MGLAALVLPLFDDELFLTIMRTCLNDVEAADAISDRQWCQQTSTPSDRL
jgi:hypothetical protein